MVLLFLVIFCFTSAHFMADTVVYSQAVIRCERGLPSPNYRSKNSNPFWDFGHLLWRPAGWLTLQIARPLVTSVAHHSLRAAVLLVLIGLNCVASVACVICFSAFAGNMVENRWAVAAATVGFFCADGFLNYAHTGNAYVIGLTWLVLGMWMLSIRTKRKYMQEVLAGSALALAVLFWFPFVFVIPAAVAIIWIQKPESERLRSAVRVVGCCFGFGIAAYTVPVLILQMNSLGDIKAWVLAAGHGQIEPGGFRALARLAFSMPRSLVNMGTDGIILKRFVTHDPYAPVTVPSLLRLGWWKLVAIYLTVCVVGCELWRTSRGRTILLIVALATVPIFFFAVFIFESGSIERYLPLYPFLFLSLGFVLASERTSQFSRIWLMCFVVMAAAVNINGMRRDRLNAEREKVQSRISGLASSLGPNDLVIAVNEQDSLAQFRQNHPLDDINISSQWHTYDLLEINTERLARWREDFAIRVMRTWENAGTVWIPQRLRQAAPQPEWNWVEGDDKRITWPALNAFVLGLEVGPVVGGEDGFEALLKTDNNRRILTKFIGSAAEQQSSETPSSRYEGRQ